MRALTVLAALAAALAVGCAEAATSGSTTLTITYRADRSTDTAVRWTLRCGPAGGTHPAAVRACRRLSDLGASAFARVPGDAVCTQQYGGPQTALVTGTYRGRRIWTRFARRDGCEISRWNRHVPVVPSAAA